MIQISCSKSVSFLRQAAYTKMRKELLWQKLANKLAHRIATGRYPLGSQLPTELMLVETEKVSRNTVRAALQELKARGLIERQAHNGTRVIATGGARNSIRNCRRFEISTISVITTAVASQTLISSQLIGVWPKPSIAPSVPPFYALSTRAQATILKILPLSARKSSSTPPTAKS